MPKLDLNSGLEKQKTVASHYGFSAVSLNKLTGTDQYTLVTIAVDKSGSVDSFQDEINKTIQTVVESCRHSPRADNLLLRVVEFDTRQEELHGFKLLLDCNVGDYVAANMARLGGGTALFDTTLNCVESAIKYGKDLTDQDYSVNGLVVIITDGDDNSSKTTPKFIKDELANAKKTESLESLLTILVGVNVSNPQLKQYLENFKNDAGLDSYINLEDVSAKKLAKLAQFISKSISSTSQALGSGGPSKLLTF